MNKSKNEAPATDTIPVRSIKHHTVTTMIQIFSLLAALIYIGAVCGYSIEGKLELPSFTPEESYGTHLELTNLQNRAVKKTFITSNGTFEFCDLNLGSYFLEIDTLNYVLDCPRLRIDIRKKLVQQEDGSEQEDIVTTAFEYRLGHATEDVTNEVEYPLIISLHPKFGQKQYYEIKDKGLAATGQLGVILSNPLLLAGIGFVGLVLGLPYLLEKMDPEAAAKMKGTDSAEEPAFVSGNAALEKAPASAAGNSASAKTKASGASKSTTKATKRKT